MITEFGSEARLVTALLSFIRRSRHREFKFEQELDAGVGVADVVLYKRRPRSAREVQLLATISPRLAPLLDEDTNKSIHTIDDLAAVLGLSKPAVDRLVGKLAKLDLIKISASGVKLVSVKLPPFETIITVEAKLSDWSRALVQAYRNRQFADESWVVLDHRYYKPAVSQLERFRRSGVGLASIDVCGDFYIHNLAPAAAATNFTKRWHAQAALARRVYLRAVQL
jgi:hypothetical protein